MAESAEGVAANESEGVDPRDVLAVRRGPGANCSSVGSVLDVLFASATLGGLVLVAVAAALDDARDPAKKKEIARHPPERRGDGADAR